MFGPRPSSQCAEIARWLEAQGKPALASCLYGRALKHGVALRNRRERVSYSPERIIVSFIEARSKTARIVQNIDEHCRRSFGNHTKPSVVAFEDSDTLPAWSSRV
jgi:hypothetical protein